MTAGLKVSVDLVLQMIDNSMATMTASACGDDFVSRAMVGGASAVLNPLRVAVIKLADLEASLEDAP